MQTPDTIESLKEAFSIFNRTSERLGDAYQRLESRTSALCSEISEVETQEREERLQSMGWLITRVVHEIRNPLGSIELISSLLRRELKNDIDKQNLLNHVIFGVKNIDNALSNFLHFAHSPKPKFDAAGLHEVVTGCLEVVSHMIEKNHIEVISDIPDDIQIYCDKSLMRQVFVNLFLNSLHAMPPGGALTIKAFEKNDSETIDVYLKDTGSGIRAEDIKKIFDPFFTTKENGTGLGLTIVHNIITAHGGSIKAYSKSGEGSLFVINIPKKCRVMGYGSRVKGQW